MVTSSTTRLTVASETCWVSAIQLKAAPVARNRRARHTCRNGKFFYYFIISLIRVKKKNVKKMCLSEFLRTTEILKSLVIGTLLQHLKQRGIVGNAIYGLDRAPPTNLQGRMLTCSMKERPPPTLLPLVRSVQAPYSFDIFLTRFLLRRYFLTNRPSLHLRNGLCLSR